MAAPEHDFDGQTMLESIEFSRLADHTRHEGDARPAGSVVLLERDRGLTVQRQHVNVLGSGFVHVDALLVETVDGNVDA